MTSSIGSFSEPIRTHQDRLGFIRWRIQSELQRNATEVYAGVDLSTEAIGARYVELLGLLTNLDAHTALLQLDGDLEARGWNAAIDAVQDMARNASYLKAGEFSSLLDHVRKDVPHDESA